MNQNLVLNFRSSGVIGGNALQGLRGRNWKLETPDELYKVSLFIRQNEGKKTLNEESHVKKILISLLHSSSKCFTRVRHTQNRPLGDTRMRTLL